MDILRGGTWGCICNRGHPWAACPLPESQSAHVHTSLTSPWWIPFPQETSILEAGEEGRFSFSLLSFARSLPTLSPPPSAWTAGFRSFSNEALYQNGEGTSGAASCPCLICRSMKSQPSLTPYSALVWRRGEFYLDRSIFHPRTVNIYGP